MRDGDEGQAEERLMQLIERRWRSILWLLFFGACAYFLFYKWGQIRWLALADTDDNLRLAEVKAWLDGQAWFDLRQHKLAPPDGLNVHWSRIVDLPIAALMLAARPFFDSFTVDRIATAIAPMLAMAPALFAIGFTVRRLVHPRSYPIAFAILMCAQITLFMWMPLRVDHHGWQLAMLTIVVAGLADRKARRGGLMAGLATAVSFGIGLELIPMMAIAGASIALRWAWRPEAEADRLRAYAIALGGGCAVAFAGFASYDNRQLVCDVLSPVYLSTLLLSAALLTGLSFVKVRHGGLRLALLIVAGGIIAAFFAISFPNCLGRPERISPELERLWFVNIREVKPLYTKPWRDALDIAYLPVIGAIGALVALWRARRTPNAPAWASVALLSLLATAGLAWQSRFGPQAQLLGVFGATALAWMILPRLLNSGSAIVRVGGTLAAFFAISGQAAQFATLIPDPKPTTTVPAPPRTILRPARCQTLPALRDLDALPATTMLTFIDLGPRLIAMTKHSAIAGPYHRNGSAILDVQHAFRAKSPKVAHEVMKRRGATMLLLCPGMAESTIYRAQNRDGFYMQLVTGDVPTWLEPVDLPETSPFLLWKMVG